MDNRHNYCVILGGGVGSRFWPISRQAFPKQFLDFFGTGRTLLQQTFDRFRGIIPLENIFVISNEAYENIVKEQLPEIFPAQILLEPTRRNTAPCIAWAAYHIRAIDPEANIVVTPSDHLILKEREFLDSVSRSLQFVSRHKKLVTLGVKPNRVETRYGYIQIADDCEDGFYKVKTFTEKPEYELAKVFVESGEFYWNSGLFVWNVDTFIEAVKHLIPELYAKLDPGTGIYNTELEADFIRENFPYCPNISIDLGIMEKAGNVFVFFGLIIAELVLVFFLSARIRKISKTTAGIAFIGYSIINGLTLSSVLLVYAGTSVARVFVITALLFGVMTVYGMTTKSDLMSAGRYLFMGLVGIIIASLVNIFLRSSGLDWIISLVGVALFTGLTAYDTQKVIRASAGADDSEAYSKIAIIAALELYLDFVNLFLYLLRLFGKKD